MVTMKELQVVGELRKQGWVSMKMKYPHPPGPHCLMERDGKVIVVEGDGSHREATKEDIEHW